MKARFAAFDAFELPPAAAALSAAALLFLRGHDADARVQALVAARARGRPLLATLARVLVERRVFEPLGFRCLGDYARERLGITARAVREWARVWRALEGLPQLRAAVTSGEVSWSVARRIVALVTPETEVASLETVRGRTVRAVEAMLAVAFPDVPTADDDDGEDRVTVRVAVSPRGQACWQAALELARRVAGEPLPVWECAEAIAAEALSAIPSETLARAAAEVERAEAAPRAPVATSRVACEAREHGLRHRAFPDLRWDHRFLRCLRDPDSLLATVRALSPHAIDALLCRTLRRLQAIDHDLGRLLHQIAERKLHRELGFGSFERYVEERTDVSPRTARRWVRLARLGPGLAPVVSAFRAGEVTEAQARAIGGATRGRSPRAWLAFAQAHTLRRLEDEIASTTGSTGWVVFRAPREAAGVFRLALRAARLHLQTRGTASSAGEALAWMLEHAIASFSEQGAQFEDYADFTRDGFRCTVPGCTARRNLHAHHVRFRSAGGPDEPSNRTTLCAFHHLRGVHAGTVRCTGRAPDGLRYELGVRPSAPPLLVALSGDSLVPAEGRGLRAFGAVEAAFPGVFFQSRPGGRS